MVFLDTIGRTIAEYNKERLVASTAPVGPSIVPRNIASGMFTDIAIIAHAT